MTHFLHAALMDENSRTMHRFRPRPYDLRRKVLLKNFLREQMTYIPPLRGSSEASLEVDNDSNLSEEPTTSVGNEENIDNLKNDHLNSALPNTTKPQVEQMPSSSSTADERCVENSFSNDSSKDPEPIPPSKFSLVSNLLKFKGSSRKKRKKGITKAKHVFKVVKSPNKNSALHVQHKAKLDSNKPAKEKKSFFSLFKSRKEKRNKVMNSKKMDSLDTASAPPVDTVQTTSQSVQTDISWPNAEYNELERSNKCLQEENRLLSESLSFIMDFKTSSQQEKSVCTDSYCNNESKTSKQEAPTTADRSTFSKEPEKIAQSCKILRSKSVQEKCNISRIRLRSRSMNFPGTSKVTNNFSPGHSSRDSYSTRSRFVPASANVHPRSLSPQLNRTSVLKSLPINSSRTIVRRSSMPERTSREPVRPLLRQRSNSIRAYNQSSDAYRNPNSVPRPSSKPSALRSIPPNNLGKPIVRRSSMPERLPHNYYRSAQRHHSVNDRDYINAPNKYSNGYRYRGNCSRSVPFRNLPNEAFY